MLRPFLVLLSIGVFAGAAGFVAGRWSDRPVAVRTPSPAPDARAQVAPPPAPLRPAVAAPAKPESAAAHHVESRPSAVAVQKAELPPTPPDLGPARLRALTEERDPIARTIALAEVLRGLTAQNARSLADSFRAAMRDERGGREMALVMDAWGRLDGPAAVAYAEEFGNAQIVGNALTGWAMKYPEAARQWAKAHETDADNHWMIPVIEGAARTQLASAVQMLYALPFGAARGRSLDAVVEAYAQQGNSALRNWAEGISDSRLREGTVARVAPLLARDDPREAAEWALKHAGEERLAQALIPVVSRWAQKEPAEAVAWAEKLEPGRTRDIALEHTVGSWAWRDPAAAEAWLTRTPPGPAFDRARVSIGMRYFETDPVRAMTWVSTVSDERMRNRMLERIAGAWSERDPAAAAKFLTP